MLWSLFFGSRTPRTSKRRCFLEAILPLFAACDTAHLSGGHTDVAQSQRHSEANRHPWIWTAIYSLAAGSRLCRRTSGRARSQHRDYDRCSALGCPGQKRIFFVPLYLCGLAPVFEPVAGSLVDATHHGIVLLSF